MNIEIRACKDQEELQEYGRIISYVFANSEGVEEEITTTLPEWTTCAFIDGKMGATMGTFPFTVRLNGAGVKMGGVTAVGTLPEHRRKGILRKIMTQGFAEMRERGQAYAILWASMGAIYQRFGYGLASTGVDYTFDPRFAGFESGPEPTGNVSLMAKDEAYPILKQLYIQFASPRNLQIHRAPALWEASVFRPRKKGEPVYFGVYRNGDGEARGHIVYRTYEEDRPGPNQTLDVSDFVALDMDAYRGLWGYIRRHDLVGTVKMRGVVGEDDPAPDLLLEPRVLRRSTQDAIWMRVVDIEKAVPQRPYGDRGELTFRVDGDAMCPWNEGTWLFETDGTTTDIRRTDRAADLEMPLNTLASLLAGHRAATHYQRAGRLTANSDNALRAADRLFATAYAPFCSNGF
ncbi:hypothetical protein AYO38_04550 [bacterium SCGC AG-212-C10]|nr:hypothetical protein AYO38_04550 [bacterium SCGC AG-212-C10]